VELAVLRKDFTVSEADVCDARLMGADAVLLIVAALADAELVRLRALAVELGLAALIEVHDEAELARAVDAGADLVGVNQRDLMTFEVDPHRAERLAPQVPAGVVKVAESGVRDAADAARLAGCGFDAVLVGESLVRAPDREAAVRSLLGEASPLAPLGGARKVL
jgi:indole-3-glycerol phosphate synthase